MNLEAIAADAEALAGDALNDLPADLNELAVLLLQARRAKRAMSDVERAVEAAVAEAMPDKRVTIEGLATLERKRGADRKAWDHERLGAQLAALSRDERVLDESTGQIEGEAEAAVRVLLACARPSYYRVGALRERGIEPDDFCDVEYGRVSVQVLT